MTAEDDLETLRARLLAAALVHVPFDGWSAAALRAGAADLEVPEIEAQNAFPGGARDLIELFSRRIDQLMLERLGGSDLDNLRVRDRVALGIETRLELLEPYREAVRHGMVFLALPQNAALASRLLWRTVDAVWYAAGDTATDYNFYSKRLLLLGVYSSTVLFWLSDRSPDHGDSRQFLARRIDNVLKLGGGFGKRLRRAMDLPDRLLARRARTLGASRRL